MTLSGRSKRTPLDGEGWGWETESRDQTRGVTMTDCSADLTLFPLSHKPVVVRADGGALTSDAGALLLRRIDDCLGLTRRLAGGVADRRAPAKVRQDLLSPLRQRLSRV